MTTPTTPIWQYERAIARVDKEIAELQAKRLRIMANMTKALEAAAAAEQEKK